MSKVFTLAKPIKAHGEEGITELELADPDTKLVMELGYPYLVIENSGDAGVQMQPKVAGRYISRLAKIPMTSVEQLAIADLQSMQGWLMNFFGEGETET